MRNPFSKLFRKDEPPKPDVESAAGGPADPAPDAPKRNPADHLKGFRFPRGTSGNPAGRPRGTSMKAVYNELLAMEDAQGVTGRERMGEVVFRKALRGNLKCIKEITDRTDGKTRQPVELEGALTIRVEYADDQPEAAEAAPGPTGDPPGGEPV